MSDNIELCLLFGSIPTLAMIAGVAVWMGAKERKKKLGRLVKLWTECAQNLGLTFREEGSDKPVVLSGIAEGVRIEAAVEVRRDAHGSATYVVIRAEHAQPLPVGFKVMQYYGLPFVGPKSDRVHTGDAEFDDVFAIQSSNPEKVLSLWNSEARGYLLAIRGQGAMLQATEHEILFELIDSGLEFAPLEKTILDLVRLAKILQGAAYLPS